MRRLAVLLIAFACNKPAPQAAAAPDASADPADSKALLAEVDRLKDQLKDKPKTFEVLSALGNLYYENGRYLEAVDSLRQALEMSAPFEAREHELLKQGAKTAVGILAECW